MVKHHTCPLLRSVTPAAETPADSLPSLSYVPHSEVSVVKTETPEQCRALKKAKSSAPAPVVKTSAVKGAAAKPGGSDPVRTPHTKCKGELPCLTPSPPPKAVPKTMTPPTKTETSGTSQLTKLCGAPVPKPSSKPNPVKTIPSVPKPMASAPSVYLSKPVASHVKHDLAIAGPTHKPMTNPPPKPSCKEELAPSKTLVDACIDVDSDDDVPSTVPDIDLQFQKEVEEELDRMAKENTEIPVPTGKSPPVMTSTSQPGIVAPAVPPKVPVEVPVAEATPATAQVETPGDQASAPEKPAATPVGAPAAAEKPAATPVETPEVQASAPAEKPAATPVETPEVQPSAPAEKPADTPAPDKTEAEATPKQAQETQVASTLPPAQTKPAFTPLEPPQPSPPTTLAQRETPNADSIPPATAAPAKASPQSVPPVPAKKKTQEETDEEWIRGRFQKMDDADTKKYLKAAKKHPLLQQYVHEDLGLGATLKEAQRDYNYVFGDEDDTEELINFELWLLRKSRITSSTPAASPATTAEANQHCRSNHLKSRQSPFRLSLLSHHVWCLLHPNGMIKVNVILTSKLLGTCHGQMWGLIPFKQQICEHKCIYQLIWNRAFEYVCMSSFHIQPLIYMLFRFL